MRVIAQVGYMKAGRRRVGQLVRMYINDSEISWGDCEIEGKYLTSRVDTSKGTLWYLCDIDLDERDTLRVDVKTSIVGVGTDEDKTFEALYYVNSDAPVKEIFVSGVGMKGYPLLKGRVLEIGSVSEADNRKSEIDDFLGGDF